MIKFWTLLAAAVWILMPAQAADISDLAEDSLKYMTDSYINGISAFITPLTDAARRLFWLLLPISLVLSGARAIFTGGNLQSITALLFKICLFTGIFYALLEKGPYITSSIVDSMTMIADDEQTGPSELFAKSANVLNRFMEAVSDSSCGIFDKFMLVLPCFWFFYCMIRVVIVYTVTYLSAYCLCVCGAWVLGLASMPQGRSIAINFIFTVTSQALMLMVMIILCNTGFTVLSDLSDSIFGESRKIVFSDSILIVFVGMFLMGMVETLPRIVGSLVLNPQMRQAEFMNFQNAGTMGRALSGSIGNLSRTIRSIRGLK